MTSCILKGASFLSSVKRFGRAVSPMTTLGNTTLTRLIRPTGQAAFEGFTLLGQPFVNAPREFMRARKFRGISKDINKARKAVSAKGPWATELKPALNKLTKHDMIWPEEALDVPRRKRQDIESFLNRESVVAEMTEQDAIDNLVKQLQRAGVISTSAGVPALAGLLYSRFNNKPALEKQSSVSRLARMIRKSTPRIAKSLNPVTDLSAVVR